MKPVNRSLFSYLRETAEQCPEKRLLSDGKRWLHASETLEIAARIAAALYEMGIQRGDAVAFRCKRTVGAALMIFGLRAAGAFVLLMDPRQEVSETLAATETPISARFWIEQESDTAFLVTSCEEDAVSCRLSLFSLPSALWNHSDTSGDYPAFVIFTSGTTGKSKAVVLSDSNLVNNLLDSHPLGDYRQEDLALCALPLHHVFGLALLAGIAVLGYGMCIPAETDVESLLAVIARQRLTRMNGVPSLYQALAAKCDAYDISSMRSGFIGGSPMTEKQYTDTENKLGMTLIPVYGMSECIGISCGSVAMPLSLRAHSVGRFYPMNSGKILREDGTEAELMEEGEICVTGPARMLGYYGQMMPRDELLHTGDMGYVDADGYLYVTGRKKNIIIRNGNNLSPRRIEEALLALPGIREAVVVGLQDEQQGEVPAAMLVADSETAAPEPKLNKNELPVCYHYVNAIPLTASGKPDLLRIREVLTRCRNG